MSRGNERKSIYLDDRDRERFLERLEATAKRLEWQCFGYCLMGNHYHLVVRTPKPNLPRGMQLLNSGYAHYFNARHDRVGHLFQGRYSSAVIRSAEHLLTVLRYVIRNPVAAGFVARPEDWPWSSYGTTLAPAHSTLVTVEETLACFRRDPAAAQGRFRSFMSDGDAELSPERDVEFPVEPLDPAAERLPIEAVLAAHPGTAGIACAYHEHGYSLAEIAAALGRSRSDVGRRLVAYESAQMLDGASSP